MASNDKAIELAAEVGLTLSGAYLKFLDELPNRPTLGEDYGPILEFDEQEWRPFGRDELAEPVQYGDGPEVAQAHETRAIAEQLRELDDEHDGEMSVALLEAGFTLARLARGFCIGDDGNGEPLFVDAETGEVFVYYHDGMDVDRRAASLDEFITGSTDWTGDEDDDNDGDEADDDDE